MKTSITKTMLLIMIAMVSILMVAQISKAGISTTKHNLSNAGPGSVKANAGQQNDEICVYCHTPHFAVTAGAPLWNKAVQTTSYTMYGTTLAGTAPDAAPNGITKACLSCHDGVNGVNSIINQAGAGGVTAGTLVAFGATAQGTAATITGSSTSIGTSLTNDHPVSIAYTETTKAGLRVKTTPLSGWVGATTIQGILRNDKVECSSCHDPHSDTNATFLRVANAGSALCIACHNK